MVNQHTVGESPTRHIHAVSRRDGGGPFRGTSNCVLAALLFWSSGSISFTVRRSSTPVGPRCRAASFPNLTPVGPSLRAASFRIHAEVKAEFAGTMR